VKESLGMAQKRALVVDDSKAARVALKRLLERYDLMIHFAESGEQAIEFLKNQSVDVIFMDHSMPGMDGFEAVSVIKSDPRTAMIPVMMYTAKEGEVYVGQARALGAVGVLPKEVQPGVLFEMLHKLGLVEDRRAAVRRRSAEGSESATAPEAGATGMRGRVDEAELAMERQALGTSIQALVTRTLQDQHLELRADILASNKDFARRVADEIYGRQQAEAALREPEAPPRSGLGMGGVTGLLLLAAVPLAALFFLFSQAEQQRDEARAESAQLRALLDEQALVIEDMRADLGSLRGAEREGDRARRDAMLAGLEWAVNERNQFAFDELPFDDTRLDRLGELLSRLSEAGFSGTVRLEAHLGQFCLAEDGATGVYRLAEAETPISECALIGHPLGDSAASSHGQSASFANFLDSGAPLLTRAGIEVEAVTHGIRDSVRRYPYPSGVRTAGELNRVAALNNRIEYMLIPAR